MNTLYAICAIIVIGATPAIAACVLASRISRRQEDD